MACLGILLHKLPALLWVFHSQKLTSSMQHHLRSQQPHISTKTTGQFVPPWVRGEKFKKMKNGGKKFLLSFFSLSIQSNQRYKGDLSPRGYGPSSPTHKLPASYAGDKWGSEMLSRNSPQDAKERTCVSHSVSHPEVPWVWVLWGPDLPKGLPCTLQ